MNLWLSNFPGALCALKIHLLGLVCVCMISKFISQVSLARKDVSYWSFMWYTCKRLVISFLK